MELIVQVTSLYMIINSGIYCNLLYLFFSFIIFRFLSNVLSCLNYISCPISFLSVSIFFCSLYCYTSIIAFFRMLIDSNSFCSVYVLIVVSAQMSRCAICAIIVLICGLFDHLYMIWCLYLCFHILCVLVKTFLLYLLCMLIYDVVVFSPVVSIIALFMISWLV